MLTDKIKLLNATKARVAKLEAQIDARLNRELAKLPAQYDFATVKEFVDAVEAASEVKKSGKTAKKGTATKPRAKPRKRAKITTATRAEVKKLVKAGRTGSQIAKEVKISLPSVQNIKKGLGLIRTGKKAGSKAKGGRVTGKTAKRATKRVVAKKTAAPEVKPNPAVADTPPVPAT